MCIPYRHFSTSERESLLVMQIKGYGIRKMAGELGRSPSSVSRELKRNSSEKGYSPSAAQAQYRERRTRCVRKKRLSDPSLQQLVTDRLMEYWSPEQIAGRLKRETGRCQIGYSTIYRAFDAGELNIPKTCFRRKRRKPSPHAAETRGRIHDYRHIEERPKSADTASAYGHWEADTVLGARGKGAIATFVERRSGYLIIRLMPDRKAETLKKVMIEAFSAFPANLKRTFTVDHGNEFFSFREIESELDTKIYFADPYSPWQRGLNENTNGLLRQYFPKKFDFHATTQAHLDIVELALNCRPRKGLGFRSPFERLYRKVLHFT